MSIGALMGIALAVWIGVVGGGGLLVLFGLWLWGRLQDRRARAVLPEDDPYEYPDEDLDDRPDELLEDEGRGRHHLRPDDTARLDAVEWPAVDDRPPLADPVRPYMHWRQP